LNATKCIWGIVIYLLEFFSRAENVSSIVKFDIKNLMGRNIQPMTSLQKKSACKGGFEKLKTASINMNAL
jgi:hypothetical protein